MINTINAIMHQKGIGVVYLDQAANIIDSSSIADEIIKSTSRLWCRGKQLCFEDSLVKNKLVGHFNNAANKEKNTIQVYIKESAEQLPIALSIFPVIDEIKNSNGESTNWLMLLKDTKTKATFSSETMASFYELTRAETDLVTALYNGSSLAMHANKRGVKITTIRWTLDNIFSKTFTHSQSELKELINNFVD